MSYPVRCHSTANATAGAVCCAYVHTPYHWIRRALGAKNLQQATVAWVQVCFTMLNKQRVKGGGVVVAFVRSNGWVCGPCIYNDTWGERMLGV